MAKPPRTCHTGPLPGQVTVCLRQRKSRKDLPQITDSKKLCTFMRQAADRDRESFYAIALDPHLRVLGVEEVARGQVDGVSIHPRESFKSAILQGASSVIVAHNHPSGDPAPSEDDFYLTKRFVSAGNLLGIPVMDHIVLGRSGCASIRDQRPTLFVRDEFGAAYAKPRPGVGVQRTRERRRRR